MPPPTPHQSQDEPAPEASGGAKLTSLRRWLREPLLHFLLAGALVFAIYEVWHPAVAQADRSNQITLTDDDLRQLAVHFLAQGRSLPTPAELRELVDEKVREEILTREAVALGLDKDDEIIKRRLVQKMDFLAQDLATLQAPSDADLAKWYTQHADRFALPPRASFRHLYFSLDRPGAKERAAAALVGIAGKSADDPRATGVADPFMFQDYYAERTPEQVAREFGPPFANALFQLKPGAWQGPVQSGYGWHLVFIDAIEPSRVPAFEEVEADVKSAWLNDQQSEIKRTTFDALRAHYTVVVPPLESVDLRNLGSPQRPVAAMDVVPE
jgi:peptidyl-prolyl cis-trans isomerase C